MIQDQLPSEDVAFRAVDREDGIEYVVDLGPAGGDATVDVVSGTAILLVDDRQYDLDLPEDDAQAFIRNGVLTITTEDSS